VKELPLIGELPQALVFVAVIWAVLGTALLAIAHARLLGASKGRVLMAIPIVFGIWYLSVTYLPSLSDKQRDIPVWQGAYLLCMFSPKPGFLRPQRGTVHHVELTGGGAPGPPPPG
jgi:hypothetical protein